MEPSYEALAESQNTSRAEDKCAAESSSTTKTDGGNSACKEGDRNVYDVLVLGAGMAGIACADALRKGGVKDLLVLEGSDKIGGRVVSEDFAGTTVELGANWIHGNPPQPLWEIAKKSKLKTFSDDNLKESDRTYSEQGGSKQVPHRLLRWRAFDKAYDKFEKELRCIKSKGVEHDELMSDVFERCGWKPNGPLDNLVEWAGIDWDYAVQANTTGTIAKPDDRELWGDVDHIVCDERGFVEIIKELGKDLVNSKSVIFEQRVVKIQWADDQGQNTPIIVTVQQLEVGSGKLQFREYRAHAVVCTFSQGVLNHSLLSRPHHDDDLQDTHLSFVPKLPQWKVNAIQKIQMAHYCKLFLEFDQPFWDDVEIIYYASFKRGVWPGWQNLNKLPFFKGKNILLATLTGDVAVDMCSNYSDEQIVDQAMQVLRAMYGTKVPAKPASFIFTRWATNKWTFGSYSSYGLGSDKEDAALLAAPVGQLYFSGEATHGVHFGTLHGALSAGQATADAVLSQFNKA